MIKISIIQCDTFEELKATLDKISMDEKNIFTSIVNDREKVDNLISEGIKVNDQQREVDGSMLEILLLKKGYKVRSSKAKQNACKKLYIRSVRRGSKWKYMLSDIERIPARISKSAVVKEARKVMT
jgi:hypothetical protein